uniref:Radiation-inducible immediate-early gene IEX-1 n=1 Tax=Knipowitschia caucasica TaxID=637954 RepID=A0AAV2MQC2_KNICA
MSVVLPASGDSQTLEKTSLNQTLVKQPRVHSVRRRRVLFPSRTKRPRPGPEPDLVQRALLLLWALLWLQVYVEETEIQSPSTDLPELESEDSATILDANQSGVRVESWNTHTDPDLGSTRTDT